MLKWIKTNTNFVKNTDTREALRRYVEVEYNATGDYAEFLVNQLIRKGAV